MKVAGLHILDSECKLPPAREFDIGQGHPLLPRAFPRHDFLSVVLSTAENTLSVLKRVVGGAAPYPDWSLGMRYGCRMLMRSCYWGTVFLLGG